MLELIDFLGGLLPPKDPRQRRYWRIGLALGGFVLAAAVLLVVLGDLV